MEDPFEVEAKSRPYTSLPTAKSEKKAAAEKRQRNASSDSQKQTSSEFCSQTWAVKSVREFHSNTQKSISIIAILSGSACWLKLAVTYNSISFGCYP